MSLLKKLLGWAASPSSSTDGVAGAVPDGDSMTPAELIAEGRRVQRDCVLLKPAGTGEPAATWHDPGSRLADARGLTPWLSVDTRCVPGLGADAPRFVTIFTDDESAGLVEPVAQLPPGIPLYAYPASVLPPIEAVFALGSDRVATWLAENGWDRDERYNDNFADRALVEAYIRVWFEEYPVYRDDQDAFAMLGGWHLPMADDDWFDLLPEHLLALTLRDSEPWVEAWQHPSGRLHVVQRIT